MQNGEIGHFGENVAATYLIKKGYRLLGHNLRIGYGEIDLILRDRRGVLIFCEIKTLNVGYSDFGRAFMPEDNLSQAKLIKMKRAATTFTQRYPSLVSESKGWRIDLISVAIKPDHSLEIHHYQNL